MYQVLFITNEIWDAQMICQTDNLEIAETYMDAFIENTDFEEGHVVIYDKSNSQFLQYTI